MSWTNDSIIASTWTADVPGGNIFYIMTDTPDYVLVGSSEDEFLVWQLPTIWTNQSKT